MNFFKRSLLKSWEFCIKECSSYISIFRASRLSFTLYFNPSHGGPTENREDFFTAWSKGRRLCANVFGNFCTSGLRKRRELQSGASLHVSRGGLLEAWHVIKKRKFQVWKGRTLSPKVVTVIGALSWKQWGLNSSHAATFIKEDRRRGERVGDRGREEKGKERSLRCLNLEWGD